MKAKKLQSAHISPSEVPPPFVFRRLNFAMSFSTLAVELDTIATPLHNEPDEDAIRIAQKNVSSSRFYPITSRYSHRVYYMRNFAVLAASLATISNYVTAFQLLPSGPISPTSAAFVMSIFVVIITSCWSWLCQKVADYHNNSHKSGLARLARKTSKASLTTLKKVASSTSFVQLSDAAIKCFGTKRKSAQHCAISAHDFFISMDVVQQLSLEELTTVIRYAMECNRPGFDAATFRDGLSGCVQQVISSVDGAVSTSRGESILLSERPALQPMDGGEMDALYFCAVMRLLIEWRSVRIVPEEYKAYAVGMNVAKRDFLQNTAKVEEAVHGYIEYKIAAGFPNVHSPTIRQVLDYEVIHNVHPRLPNVKDKTAAIGIVWMNRQLEFQTAIFSNLTQVPEVHENAIAAVRAAYKSVFNRYHGWAIQQVFNYSFNGAPPSSLVFELISPEIALQQRQRIEAGGEDELMLDGSFTGTEPTTSFSSSSTNYDDDNDSLTSKDDTTDKNIFQLWGDDIKKNWEKMAENIKNEWCAFTDDLLNNSSNNNKRQFPPVQATAISDTHSDPGGAIVQTTSSSSSSSSDQHPRSTIPRFIVSDEMFNLHLEMETSKAARSQIDIYLNVMVPVLKDILATINELGMNDPSKV